MAAATKPAAAAAETPVVEAAAVPEAPETAIAKVEAVAARAFEVLRDFKAMHGTQLVTYVKGATVAADDPSGEAQFAAGAPLKPLA